ncbi:hypothetical protein [Diaminobutyricimonas sp. LJ205]|uniref:hypothetical protein n=1 Tax=Diaminobutyricimonas sp. LJ205 TaxID=2683590 RepID=UPI0012F4E211|nr:hypothetical protein [Diaminobutyricimonas sp. LJ205]
MAAAAVAFVSFVAVGPAAAAPPERFLDQSDEVIENFCGDLTVRRVVDIDVRASEQARGSEGLIYFAEHFHGSVSWTNVDNGLTLTDVFRVNSKDLRVTDNGDGTLTIIAFATGGAKTYGPDGKLLFRDPGQIRFEVVVNHAGTPTDPSDDIFISERVVKESTGLNETEDRDFCDDIHEFIG